MLFSVRDKQGKFVEIPVIVGPKGDPGKDAEVTAENIEAALGYTPANKAILYDQEQTLTDAEKEQARKNIGAMSSDVKIEGAVLYTQQTLTDEQKAQARANIGIEADGSVVNVDTTLSMPGVAADAKAVGDEITRQADIVYEVGKNKVDISKVIYAGNGSINGGSGALVDGTNWVYGDYELISGETYTISKTGGAQILYFYNEDGSYTGGAQNITVSATSNTLTFVAPAPIVRILAYGDLSTRNLQIELGDTATEYESFGYALKENMRVTDPKVVNNLLEPNKVTDKYIADGGVHAQKLHFTEATDNLINPLTCVSGYLSTKGNIAASGGHFTTDFIPISAEDAYVRLNVSNSSIVFYDANKTFISYHEQVATAQIPDGAAYVRATINSYLSNAHKYMLYVGNTEKDFVPYRVVPQKYIEQVADPFPKISLVLTKDLYVANGVKVDIHAQSITKGINVDKMVRPISMGAISGSVPYKVYGKHIEIVGGDKADLTASVYCEPRWGKSVKQNIDIHNVSADAGSGQTKKVLFIGDSKTDANVYTQCLLDMFANDPMSIQLLGTRGNTDTNRHEGRSGWSAEFYCENNPDRGIKDENGEFPDSPFYNPTTKTFDFAYYMEQNGYDGVDYVFINLGTNDSVSNFIGYYHEMVDSIRAYDSNIIIGIWVPAPFATFGGYTHTANDNQTFAAMEAVISEFDTAENQANKIFVVPTHMNLNTEYDYPWKDVPYTTAKPEHTYRVCTDQIHESNGYYKDANVIFGYIKHFATLQ